jgi:hypothetical protein
MTYVHDLHEADDQRPGEPEQEPLIDLDEVETAYNLADVTRVMGPHTQMAFSAVPVLVRELREARQRIAEWEALEKREEWVVTPNRDSVPCDGTTISCADQAAHAEWLARTRGAQMWRRMLSVHPWEPIDSEAPF